MEPVSVEMPIVVKNDIFYQELMVEAISNNQAGIFEFLKIYNINNFKNQNFLTQLLHIAISSASFAITEYLLKVYFNFLNPTCSEKHMHLIIPVTKFTLDFLFLYRRLDVLNRLVENHLLSKHFLNHLKHPDARHQMLTKAIQGGSLELLQRYLSLIEGHTPEIDFRAPTAAAAFSVLKLAIGSSSVEIVDWLRGCLPIDVDNLVSIELLMAALSPSRASIFRCLLSDPDYKYVLIKWYKALLKEAISRSSLDIIEQMLDIKAAKKDELDDLLWPAVKRQNLDVVERLFLLQGIQAGLKKYKLPILRRVLDMKNQPMFEFLFSRVERDSLVAHDEPITQDLLYVALSKANEPAIDLLLKNESIRRRAKESNYYWPSFSGSIRSKIELVERADSALPSFWGTDLSFIAPQPPKEEGSTEPRRTNYV